MRDSDLYLMPRLLTVADSQLHTQGYPEKAALPALLRPTRGAIEQMLAQDLRRTSYARRVASIQNTLLQ